MKFKRIFLTFLILILFSIIDVKAYKEYKVGDKVTYNGMDFYVIMNSDDKDNYIELLKSTTLTAEEIAKYATLWKNSQYTESLALVPINLNSPYDSQDFKQNIDEWVEREFGNDAKDVDGYKARLLSLADAENLEFGFYGSCIETTHSFRYTPKENVVNWSSQNICIDSYNCYRKYTFNVRNLGVVTYRTANNYSVDSEGNTGLLNLDGSDSGKELLDFLDAHDTVVTCSRYYESPYSMKTDNEYEWLKGTSFWTMVYSLVGEQNWMFYYHFDDSHNTHELYYTTSRGDSKLAIRPVVNIKKSALGNNTTYHIGDEVIYKNNSYNVLYEVDESKDYVTVLKSKPLSTTDLYNEGNDTIQYYSSNDCSEIDDNITGCTNNYDQSFVKDVIDNWANDNFKKGDLVSPYGYKARLLNLDDLIDNLGYGNIQVVTLTYLSHTEDTPEFVYDSSIPYWIDFADDEKQKASKLADVVKSESVNNKYKVRPVVFLSKCALGDKDCMICEENTTPVYTTYKRYIGKYKTGDIVTIKDEKYMVLSDVLTKTKTIKLLKLRALTKEQIDTHNKTIYNSINGEIPFNIKCSQDEDYYYENSENCVDYEFSTIKEIVDGWGEENFGQLFINSYLLNKESIIELLHYDEVRMFVNHSIAVKYDTTDQTPIEITDNEYYSYLGENYMDKYYVNAIYGSLGINGYQIQMDEPAYIRPVIEIDKCAIEGGCQSEEIVTGCLTKEGEIIPVTPPYDILEDIPKNEVPVQNTLSMMSKFTIIISIILIIVGLFMLLFNYYKTKNENKM